MKWQLAGMHNNALRPVTDEIAFRVSLRLNREARMNNNKPKGSEYEFMHKWSVSQIPAQSYPMAASLDVYAYGYN